MTSILKNLLYACILSILPGMLITLPLGISGVNIYISDVSFGLLCIYWLFGWKTFVDILNGDRISIIFISFVIFASISLMFSPINLTIDEKFISSLYILRIIAYFSIYPSILYLQKYELINIKNILNILASVGIILSIIGWLQYFLYPDLRNLFYLGWDPHYKRIFSTFLDPNYFGLILVLSMIILFISAKNYKLKWVGIFFLFLTLLFTYSRSSFLSFISSFSYYFLLRKRYWYIATTFLLLVIGMIVLPRPQGEGVRLERLFSVEERIISWKQGLSIFSKHPIIGAGFNTLRYAKRQYGYMEYRSITDHAGAGVENSFIFIAATTGTIGLILWILLVQECIRKKPIFVKVSLTAILVHSLFLNSLFFPSVMIWWWILSGVKETHVNKLSKNPA